MFEKLNQFIALNEEFDVIVIGGGPAGCAAAAAAAREGGHTLLLESTGSLGGMGTSGLVPAWCPFSDGEKLVYGGIAQTVLERSKAATSHVPESRIDWVPIDPEALKAIYDRIVTDNGVHVLFHTMALGVETDGKGEINAILTGNKAGLTAYRAKTFVDATGDGDVAAFAGAEWRMEENGEAPMPASHCFVLTNVDLYAYLYHSKYGLLTRGGMLASNPCSFVHSLSDDSRFPEFVDMHLCNNIIGPATIGFNAGHVYDVDATNPESVSNAMMYGRKLAREYCEALALYFPEAFGNAYLVETAPSMGIRESRRIIGDYVLTVEDYLGRTTFEDEICRNCYYLDVHYSKEEVELQKKGKINDKSRCAYYSKGESHGIPYRCLTPKGLTNLIVAGRSISCEKHLQGSIRVMPACLAMGEAAGIAAVMTARGDRNFHNTDVQQLRARLKEYGAYIR